MSKVQSAKLGKPAIQNIVTKRGDTFVWEITGFNDDGTPFQFAGKEFLMQVKKHPDDEEAVIEFPNADFEVSQDAAGADAGVSNVLTLTGAAEKMEVNICDHYYDLEMRTEALTFTFYEGTFTVTKDVSRLQESE